MWRVALILCVCFLTPIGRAQDDNVVELSTHLDTGVRSAWLANGIRVHHKLVGEHDDDVVVTIRLLGGAISESDVNRGITQAAMLAWSTPQTRSADAQLFQKRLSGAGCDYEGGIIDDDMVGMTLKVPSRRLGSAMRLARELLDEPSLDPESFQAWRVQQRSEIASRSTDVDGQILEVMSTALFPEDARVRPLVTDDLDQFDHQDAAAWLDRLVRTSPVEIGIAGPISSDRALEIVGTTLGTLPTRQRITPQTFARRRDVGPKPEGPISAERLCQMCNSSVALLGLYAPDRTKVDDIRAVFSALILLENRLTNIDWSTRPAPKVEMLLEAAVYPGYGMLYARVEAPRERLLESVTRVELEVDRFARIGPTDVELRGFHAGAKQEITTLLESPEYWSSRLAMSTAIGVGFDEIATLLDSYTTITAEQIRTTFAQYARGDNRFTLIVLEDDVRPTPGPQHLK